jgi:DNA (cytosine-5)-methyltransferase 1
MKQFTVGSLFSGIGGIDLGLERTGRYSIAWQIELDDYCQRVLAKHWPDVARYGDIRECGGYVDDTEDVPFWLNELRTRYPDIHQARKHRLAPVDLIAGGFPCQDISDAGARTGIDGSKSGLWAEFYRIICELRPAFVLVENVSALLHRGMERVLGDLSTGGYDAEWSTLSACAMGAPHMRERVFIVAYARCEYESWRVRNRSGAQDTGRPEIPTEWGKDWQLAQMGTGLNTGLRENWWRTEPRVDRMAPRVPHRMDRLGGLGNTVVPQVAEYAGSCLAAWIDAQEGQACS